MVWVWNRLNEKKGREVNIRYIPHGKRYWIPILGWVLLQAWSMRINARNAVPVAVTQLILLVAPAILFFELSAMFVSSVVYGDAILLIAASSLFFAVGTVFEVNYVDGHRQATGMLFKLGNWDVMTEMPKDEIWRAFFSANYHELVFAVVGTILGIALGA